MALRQGGRALARSLMQAKSLPTRGGGGGPIRYADAPNKQVCGERRRERESLPMMHNHLNQW